MKESLENAYGNRLRLRVCGLLVRGDNLLLVRHKFGDKEELWIPPGGEVHFGETAPNALKREFVEETGLEVEVGEWFFNYEYINPPFHAMELFFEVRERGGKLKKGFDPETHLQIIEDVRFVGFQDIGKMSKQVLHGIFSLCEKPEMIMNLRGYHSAPHM